jgi:MFS family permease
MRWRILPLLMAFVALAHFNRISMSVAGAEQIIRLGFLSATEMGLVYSAYLLPYTLFMVAGGYFIDRRGPWLAWVVVGLGSAVFVALTGVGVALAGMPGLQYTRSKSLAGLSHLRNQFDTASTTTTPPARRSRRSPEGRTLPAGPEVPMKGRLR